MGVNNPSGRQFKDLLNVVSMHEINLKLFQFNFSYSNRWNQRNRPLAPLAAADGNPNFCFGNQKSRQAGDTLIVEFFEK